ncbi:MAG TPA: hypothetical protein VHK01_07460 [Lacipirellulaceae bacterium]|jgi:hypothetical protein|nr:hypothetical protein [Lacipirellulaceae bacterium]
MFTNRITELFPLNPPPGQAGNAEHSPQAQHVLPIATLGALYQAAAARALRDYELDKLFNPDYYGDHGSGI